MIAPNGRSAGGKGMKGRQMRWVICALFVLGLTPHVYAADLDILRGSEPVGLATYTNWSGFYVGGQLGYGAANGDFSNATSSIISEALRETTVESEFDPSSWTILGTATSAASQYGGFIGYNSQWQDLVLSIEGNYTQTKFAMVAPITPIGRITPADSNGIPWTIEFTGSGSATDLDYGQLRGRAGVILGSFLPYGFIGFAMGEADLSVSAVGFAEGNAPTSGACSLANTPPCYLVTFNKTNQSETLVYGATIGGGLDVALGQHIFLRSEFEYLRFLPVDDIVLSAISGRVGVGLKF